MLKEFHGKGDDEKLKKSNFTPSYILKRNENVYPHKALKVYMHTKTCISNIILNSQKVKR